MIGYDFGLESGGQSLRTSIALPSLCTVGAAELACPLALGNIALFPMAMESAVFCSPLPLPVVAAPVVVAVVVQLVSGF